jgi:hypothetical protein
METPASEDQFYPCPTHGVVPAPYPAALPGKQRCWLSVIVARHKRSTLAYQEVQVNAFVGLQHMVDIQLPVA